MSLISILQRFFIKRNEQATPPAVDFSNGVRGKYVAKMEPKPLTPEQKKRQAKENADRAIADAKRAKQEKADAALEAKKQKQADKFMRQLKVGRIVNIKGIKYVVVGMDKGKPVMTTLTKFQKNSRSRIKLSTQPVIVVNNYNTSSDDGFGLLDAMLLAELISIDTSPTYEHTDYEDSGNGYGGGGGGFSGGGASGGWDDSPSSGGGSDDASASGGSDDSSSSGGSDDSGSSDSGGGSDS